MCHVGPCIYQCWCRRYLMLKDSFVAYLHPDEGTVSDVLLMDQDFTVKTGIKDTGVHNGLLISNLSRFYHVTDHLLVHPSRGVEYCNQPICLSVCVCLSVCEHISGTAGLIFTKFVPLWPWLGPPLAALRYAMYFRFYG